MSTSESIHGSPQSTQHMRQAALLYGSGELAKAQQLCQTVLAAQPQHFDALTLLGVIAARMHRTDEAAELLRRAVTARPGDAAAHANYGNVLRDLERPDEALESYQRALLLSPDSADVHYNRANVLRQTRRLAEALESYALAIRSRPDFAEAHNNRGSALLDLERFDEALASYEQALRLRPGDAEIWYNRGKTLHALHRHDEALSSYAHALSIKPEHAEAHNNRGNVLKDLRRFDEALASFERAIEIRPDLAAAHYNRGNTQRELGHSLEALESYRRALEIKPDYSWLYGVWIWMKMQLAQWSGRRAELASLIERVGRQAKATLALPAIALVDSPAVQRQAAEIWVKASCPASAALPQIEKRPRGERIRIGYYSADLHTHATAFLMAGLFECHDRRHFEVIAFSFGPASEDDMRKRLVAAFDQFIDVRGKSDREVAELSRVLGIDIAVDLKGFTADDRAKIFALRAAPVQVSYLGYPGTMGAPYIDYLIADPTLIPEEARPHYSEKIVYLPHSYQVNDRHRQISGREFTRAELGLPPEGFVFCSFNNTYKITPEVFDIWMRLLRDVPESVLWLLQDDPTAPGNLRTEARARGIDPARLVFATRMLLPEHLARHRVADLFLDTPIYNAHTTASDALWAGLPVLTRLGESFAARVAGSLLNAIGLPELITRTDAEYEAKALELARDPRRLGELREKLLAHRLTTPLFDTELFARHLEDGYRAMVERYQAGLAPEHIHVAARGQGSATNTTDRSEPTRPPAPATAPPRRAPVATDRIPLVPQAMRQAVAAYTAGDWGKAEQLCHWVLEAQAQQFDALTLLGVIAARTGHATDAAQLLGQAVTARPADASAHLNYGNALRDLRRFAEALDSYARTLELRPFFPEAHFNRANTLKELGRLADAVAGYERALQVKPDYAEAHNNRGNALRDLGRFDEALASYQCALTIKPDYAEVHANRGNVLKELGRFAEALASYQRALEIHPDYAEAHNNRGVVLTELQRGPQAIEAYDRALALRPDYAEAHNNRGNTLNALERFDEALQCYQRALAIRPDYAEAHYNRGDTLLKLRRFEEALGSYRQALRLRPDYAEAHNGVGNALKDLRRLEEALASYQRALDIRPEYAEAHNNRGNVLTYLSRADEALLAYQQALDARPDYAEAWNNRAWALKFLGRLDEALESYQRALTIAPEYEWLYGLWLHLRIQLCSWDHLAADMATLVSRIGEQRHATPPFAVVTCFDSAALQRRAAEIWVNATCPPSAVLGPLERRARGARIRVGYYSADFHGHATAFLMAELIERHHRDEFEVIAFSFGPAHEDEMRARLRSAFNEFVDVHGKSDREVAELSRKLGIDIAVDLKGYTYNQRPGIFSYRTAPIQVSYLGYPGTVGAPYIDYLVADPTLIPEEARPHYSEKIAYLPHSYQVNDRHRQISGHEFSRAELGLPPQGFVFCCFNASYKITPAVFDLWMRLLREAPGSVLWLLAHSPTAVSHLRREARARGVAEERLVFAPRLPLPEHLGRHRAADLFLDTLPCNAHTTASDALWAGLPVLTRLGESLAARVSGSLLKAIGLPELITRSAEEYQAKALELARHPERLRELRERLLANRLTTPLFDTESYTRHLEHAYRQMYERYQAGLAPEHLHVPP
jgi:predicted O-linked N-acetylglucosamine transferase (SPINDLY family)